MLRSRATWLILAAATGLAGCSDDDAHTRASAQPVTGQALPVTERPVLSVERADEPDRAEPSYPDSAPGLESLMGALVKALAEHDEVEMSRLLLSLQLPDPGGWFGDVFGPELGPSLAAEHEPQRAGIGWLARHIEAWIGTGLVSIHAERFDSPDQSAAVGYQSAALARMKKRVALYSVRFATPDGKETWHVWSFVHDRGTFRYVGKMRQVEARVPPTGGRDLLEYRQSDAERLKATGETQ